MELPDSLISRVAPAMIPKEVSGSAKILHILNAPLSSLTSRRVPIEQIVECAVTIKTFNIPKTLLFKLGIPLSLEFD